MQYMLSFAFRKLCYKTRGVHQRGTPTFKRVRQNPLRKKNIILGDVSTNYILSIGAVCGVCQHLEVNSVSMYIRSCRSCK